MKRCLKFYYDETPEQDVKSIVESMIWDNEFDRDDIILEESEEKDEFSNSHKSCKVYEINRDRGDGWMDTICKVAVQENWVTENYGSIPFIQ